MTGEDTKVPYDVLHQTLIVSVVTGVVAFIKVVLWSLNDVAVFTNV